MSTRPTTGPHGLKIMEGTWGTRFEIDKTRGEAYPYKNTPLRRVARVALGSWQLRSATAFVATVALGWPLVSSALETITEKNIPGLQPDPPISEMFIGNFKDQIIGVPGGELVVSLLPGDQIGLTLHNLEVPTGE